MRELPLVYFFSGSDLPGYASRSIAHSAKTWGTKPYLITDTDFIQSGLPAQIVDYREWFDSREFDQVLRSQGLDISFRDGFWVKTLLRLFVIEQFMEMESFVSIVHSELDSLLFITEQDFRDLPLRKEGLYIPWNPGSLAIASLILVNGRRSLRSLLDCAGVTAKFQNEMELLTRFLQEYPDQAFGLPTADRLINPQLENLPSNSIAPSCSPYLFDANRLGMWLYGTDPRNTRGWLSFNHHTESGVSNPLNITHIQRGWPAIRSSEGKSIHRVANIHMHSKRVSQATQRVSRFFWLRVSKLPFKFVVGLNLRKKLVVLRKSLIRLVDKSLSRHRNFKSKS